MLQPQEARRARPAGRHGWGYREPCVGVPRMHNDLVCHLQFNSQINLSFSFSQALTSAQGLLAGLVTTSTVPSGLFSKQRPRDFLVPVIQCAPKVLAKLPDRGTYPALADSHTTFRRVPIRTQARVRRHSCTACRFPKLSLVPRTSEPSQSLCM